MINNSSESDIIENIDREIESWVSKNKFEFKILEKPKFHPNICIQGLSGIGFAANMAISYFLKFFDNNKIAGYISELIPPFINYYGTNNEILLPITIFEVKIPNQEQSILLTLGEVPISDYALYSVAESLYKVYKELGVKQVIHFDTFVSVDDKIDDSRNELPDFHIIGTTNSLASNFNQNPRVDDVPSKNIDNSKSIDEIKYLYGISAACNIIFREMDVCSILVNAKNAILPDDLATFRMLKIIKEIIPIEIDSKIISLISKTYEKKQEQLFGINRNLYYPFEKEIKENLGFDYR